MVGSSAALVAASRRQALQRVASVRHDLYEAIEKRRALWAEPVDTAAVRELERRIDHLWHDFRAVRAEALTLPREQILASARAEARLERELERRWAREAAREAAMSRGRKARFRRQVRAARR